MLAHKGKYFTSSKMYDDFSTAKSYKMTFSFKDIYQENNKTSLNKVAFISDIKPGDITLYDNKYLMLFYQPFKTEDKYAKIGHINEIGSLNEALGEGDVNVLWSLCNPENDNCQVPTSSYFAVLLHFWTWKVLTFLCFLFL